MDTYYCILNIIIYQTHFKQINKKYHSMDIIVFNYCGFLDIKCIILQFIDCSLEIVTGMIKLSVRIYKNIF